MYIYVQNIATFSPGLDNWSEMCAALAGEYAYDDLLSQPIVKIVPQILPANERRRTTPLIKLALHVAEQAVKDLDAGLQLASVFSTSDGDHDILDKSTHALTLSGRPVSPTNFHNSVHNAPAGYWAIASKSQAYSTSLSIGDASFSGGLIEAITFSKVENQPVLFVAYEYPAQSVLQTVRECRYPFAVALVLSPEQDQNSQFTLELALQSKNENSVMTHVTFEALRKDNPAARSLPLLNCFAHNSSASCTLEHVNNTRMDIKVMPCK